MAYTAIEGDSESAILPRTAYRRMDSYAAEGSASSGSSIEKSERITYGLGISEDERDNNIPRKPVSTTGSIHGRGSISPSMPSMQYRITDATSTPRNPFENSRSEPESNSSTPLYAPRFEDNPYDGARFGTMLEEDDITRAKSASGLDEIELEEGQQPFCGINGNDSYNYNGSIGVFQGCPTNHDIHSSRKSWLSISILLLSIYSTLFSGLWLILGFWQPRYGRKIISNGQITPATASTLFALFAKTIELSFVTVFVSFLGQVLTRRSLSKDSRGVTISEFSMKTWVIQPAFMITNFKNMRHASLSILGGLALAAAFVSTFYTTASDSLVSPHLKLGNLKGKIMKSLVKTSYANPYYVSANCHIPIDAAADTFAAESCVNIEHAGQAYQNVLSYLATWKQLNASNEEASTDLSNRPLPTAILLDNTTAISVTGSWVHTSDSNIGAAYDKYERLVNNVTMSMPHAAVFAAARDPVNKILQPEDLDGLGEYYLRAAVVSPTVNVLCVEMNSTELKPLVYVKWPGALTNESVSLPGQRVAWPGYEKNVTKEFAAKPFLNRTVVDDIFEWGEKYARFPPVFPMLPIDYNSILNVSVAQSDSNYLLIKSPTTTNYTMCQTKSWLSPDCSTQYNVSGTSGGHLRSHCNIPRDAMAYKQVVPGASTGKPSGDYRNVAAQLLLSLALNTGISNANASSARILSQLVPVLSGPGKVTLSREKPSIAETLAVMSASSLLLSSRDSRLNHTWRDPNSPEAYESFDAMLASEEYTSGPTSNWQKIFYVVLFLVFLINVFCLSYFLIISGLVTDFTDSQNLFALAVNSPPSRSLAGSCGAGPKGYQLMVPWHIGQESGTYHYFIKEGDLQPDPETARQRKSPAFDPAITYQKLRTGKSWL
ncbi:hypothetical protein B0O99DRAFT_294576 [Bisporella sp. PMI_857]|nr:hypothetical protein B0O99DRAFT_294576 [Bisporella sp. PMI_857]